MTIHQRERLPRRLPRWIRERVEVNVYLLNRFMRWAGSQVPAGARLLDAGSGEGRFRSLFEHTRYTGVDLAVGDQAWNYAGLDAVSDLSLIHI